MTIPLDIAPHVTHSAGMQITHLAWLAILSLYCRFAAATAGLSSWRVGCAMTRASYGHDWCGSTKWDVFDAYLRSEDWLRVKFDAACEAVRSR